LIGKSLIGTKLGLKHLNKAKQGETIVDKARSSLVEAKSIVIRSPEEENNQTEQRERKKQGFRLQNQKRDL